MLGWQIFRHALRMLTGNAAAIVRLYLVPLLVMTGALFAAAYLFFSVTNMAIGPVWLTLLTAVLVAVPFAIVAITWHRYVLLEILPAHILPPIDPGRLGIYLQRLLLIGLMVAVALVPALILVSGMLTGLTGLSATTLLPLVRFGLSSVAVAAILRWSPALVAAALGQSLELQASWRVTAPFSKDLIVTGLCVEGLFWLLNLPLGQLTGAMAPAFWVSLLMLLRGIVMLCLATTVFGYVIEKRALT
ncbi:MAG: hypothetical protein AAGF79_16545 [Pseudomonadota bacterium]